MFAFLFFFWISLLQKKKKQRMATFRLCLVYEKFERKYKANKIERKSRKEDKIKKNKSRVKSNILFLGKLVFFNSLI